MSAPPPLNLAGIPWTRPKSGEMTPLPTGVARDPITGRGIYYPSPLTPHVGEPKGPAPPPLTMRLPPTGILPLPTGGPLPKRTLWPQPVPLPQRSASGTGTK